MDNKKPKDVNEYKKWLEDKMGIEVSEKIQRHYESVADKIKKSFEESNLWIQLSENLRTYDQEYQLEKHYPLFVTLDKPILLIKPYNSFFLKTFRKNVLNNEHWPKMPEKGWVLPNNWFSRINDIVRTYLVVKYLDGVDFIITKIKAFCEKKRCGCKDFFEAREEGYYAAHLYMRQKFEIPKIDWDTEIITTEIEIQITTQLQEVIRKLIHKYYEERRKIMSHEDIKWQWNYKSDEFVANYLGHILHYVEGMIMEIREKQREEEQ